MLKQKKDNRNINLLYAQPLEIGSSLKNEGKAIAFLPTIKKSFLRVTNCRRKFVNANRNEKLIEEEYYFKNLLTILTISLSGIPVSSAILLKSSYSGFTLIIFSPILDSFT